MVAIVRRVLSMCMASKLQIIPQTCRKKIDSLTTVVSKYEDWF